MSTGIALRRVLAGALVLAFAPACTGSEVGGTPASDTVAATVAEPPWGVDPATLPTSDDEIEAVLTSMPEQVAGLTKQPPTGNEVGYGDTGMGEMAGSMEVFLRVMDLGGKNAYGTGAPFLEAMVDTGDTGGEVAQLDPDGDLVYAAGTTAAGDVDYTTAMWAAPDSRYVFLVQGTTQDERAALIAAFNDAVAA
jgi:hypothetical protein